MRVHLVNPSHLSFGTAVITPRWLYVLAAATPEWCGDPTVTDETLEQFDLGVIEAGDVVGIGIHTGNAHKGYEIGRAARERGCHGRLRRDPRDALPGRAERTRRRARGRAR